MKELLSNIKPLTEGTAIMAKHQTKGKGQRGSTWLTRKNENLTFSFLLYPEDVAVEQAFYLNMLICLGLQQAMAHYKLQATVKWPNDIYIGDKKIGGILIENKLKGGHIHASIIGIGLNVNQLSFADALQDTATSILLETQGETPMSIVECCMDILHDVLCYCQEHARKDPDAILAAYNKGLYRRGVVAKFLVQGIEQIGRIQGVDFHGKLAVDLGNQVQHFDLKEIRFII